MFSINASALLCVAPAVNEVREGAMRIVAKKEVGLEPTAAGSQLSAPLLSACCAARRLREEVSPEKCVNNRRLTGGVTKDAGVNKRQSQLMNSEWWPPRVTRTTVGQVSTRYPAAVLNAETKRY